jgi:hypothetical protein
MTFYCSFCGHGVKTQRGLRQNIDSKPLCRSKELAKEGLFDVTKLCQKPHTIASIRKRTFKDIDSNHHFDLSNVDGLVSVPKAKQIRRFTDYEGQKNEATGKTFETLAGNYGVITTVTGVIPYFTQNMTVKASAP